MGGRLNVSYVLIETVAGFAIGLLALHADAATISPTWRACSRRTETTWRNFVQLKVELPAMQERLATSQPMEVGKRAFTQGSRDRFMLIRYGYELTFKCPQPTIAAIRDVF